jgi:hypothetical protein
MKGALEVKRTGATRLPLWDGVPMVFEVLRTLVDFTSSLSLRAFSVCAVGRNQLLIPGIAHMARMIGSIGLLLLPWPMFDVQFSR